uniref:Agenet-like domain-containing protein n=1 Tax=Gongylonema pulchrum TaxID=637853 RepID=A0A183ENI0_9BILA
LQFRLGYCSADKLSRALAPPEEIYSRRNDWREYCVNNPRARKSLTVDWPDIQYRKLRFCKFKVGDNLELLDALVSMRVLPARVVDVIGRRILVRVRADCVTAADHVDDDQNSHYVLYDEHDAPPWYFKTYAALNPGKDYGAMWKEGMTLEVLDPLDTWKELRPATVIEVLGDGYLKVLSFEGDKSEEESVAIHCSSELLFPIGYARRYDLRLKGQGKSGTSNFFFFMKFYISKSASYTHLFSCLFLQLCNAENAY